MGSPNSNLVFTVSRDLHDERWDQFLEASPLGQFQQSSLWARVKASESWECARLLVQRDGSLAGGAQLLFRSSRFGKIGYISKGPALARESEILFPSMLEALHELCRSLRLQAWILQPPDEAAWQTPLLHRSGYLPAHLWRIIDATLLLDLTQGWDSLYGNMRRTTRQRAHQAARHGMRIRVGTESDLGLFFDLMLKTCQRQGTEPNPGSIPTLRELWRAFQPGGRARLAFAELEGASLAGLLCLLFGRRVTLWKKGWGSTGRHHPNELLHLETIKWAWDSGYQCCDFVALDHSMGEAMLARRPFTQEHKASRHLFNVNLGARPKLLPPAVIYVVNPFARALYRGTGRFPALTQLLRKHAISIGHS
jgi:hypothetical protein